MEITSDLNQFGLVTMFQEGGTQKIGATNAQLSVEAQNLMLLYSDDKLNGQDPEFFSAGGVALPQPRLITTSIILGF